MLINKVKTDTNERIEIAQPNITFNIVLLKSETNKMGYKANTMLRLKAKIKIIE